MGLMKELNDLNAIYLKMHEQEVTENQDKGYVVTKADKKGNTKAWQGYKAGVKSKTTGKPLYRAADHLKNEEVEVDESIGSAIDKGLSAGADVAKVAGKAAVGGVKVASKVVKKTAGAAGRVAGTAVGAVKSAKKGYKGGAAADESFEISPEVERLIESGLFTGAEIAKIADIQEADIADILARLEKKRISKGGDPEESPLPAMRKYHADKKKKAKK